MSQIPADIQKMMDQWNDEGFVGGEPDNEDIAKLILAERKRCAEVARAYADEAREAQKYAMPGNSYGAMADRCDGIARAIEEGRQP